MTSFNNLLRSLPVGIQALELLDCPLGNNTQFVQILRQFAQLVGLEISHWKDEEVEASEQISLDDIRELVAHPPVSMRCFVLDSALIAIMKNEEAVDDVESKSMRACITALLAAAFPLKRPVADRKWSRAFY